MKLPIVLLVSTLVFVGSLAAGEPKELTTARKEFAAIKSPGEADRVKYLTSLVRMREKLTRGAGDAAMGAIDAELIKHTMPASADAKALKKLLVGRWQSPRRPYFYHADGTYAANEDNAGEVIFLLTDKDFVYGARVSPFYLRRGTAFPWK